MELWLAGHTYIRSSLPAYKLGVSWEFCKMLVPESHPPAQISIGLVWVGPGLTEDAPGHSDVLPGREPTLHGGSAVAGSLF